MKRAFAHVLAVPLIFAPTIQPAISAVWNQVNLPSQYWQSATVSADGSHMYAVSGDFAYPWLSTDYGNTWRQNTNGAQDNWYAIICSSDGSQIMAVNNGGNMFFSGNDGINWTQGGPFPDGNASQWGAIGCSADGSKYLAAEVVDHGNPGLVYLSSDSGSNWTNPNLASNNWVNGTMSADGGTLVLGTQNSLYISTDGGTSWNTTNLTSQGWAGITASTDGTRLAAVDGGANIFTSTNKGVSWVHQLNISPAITTPPSRLAASANGTRLALSVYPGVIVSGNPPGIYFSLDSGNTWTKDFNAPSQIWRALAISGDGWHVVAGAHDTTVLNGQGPLYIAQLPRILPLNIAISGTNLAFSWLYQSNNPVLQQKSGLTATNWTAVTNSPTFDPATLINQVILPRPAGSTFYRLAAP